MLLSGLWHGAGWTFLLWGATPGALMLLESLSQGFWRRAPAALTRPLMLIVVCLAWVPCRAADFDAVLACYRALGHGEWEAPSLGFLFAAGPLAAPDGAGRAGWHGWACRPGTPWPAAGVTVALLAHLFWGATEKAFIYFRF